VHERYTRQTTDRRQTNDRQTDRRQHIVSSRKNVSQDASVCVSGVDGRSAGVETGYVWKPDGYHTKSGQDMATGASNHEWVSMQVLQIKQ